MDRLSPLELELIARSLVDLSEAVSDLKYNLRTFCLASKRIYHSVRDWVVKDDVIGSAKKKVAHRIARTFARCVPNTMELSIKHSQSGDLAHIYVYWNEPLFDFGREMYYKEVLLNVYDAARTLPQMGPPELEILLVDMRLGYHYLAHTDINEDGSMVFFREDEGGKMIFRYSIDQWRHFVPPCLDDISSLYVCIQADMVPIRPI